VVTKPPYEPQSIDEFIEYLTDNSLKPVLDRMREAIKGLGKGIEEYATQSYIGYKLSSGRQFAYIRIFRKEIELGAHIVDENKQLLDYESIRVKKGDEDYSEIFEKIKRSFMNLGGTLHEGATS